MPTTTIGGKASRRLLFSDPSMGPGVHGWTAGPHSHSQDFATLTHPGGFTQVDQMVCGGWLIRPKISGFCHGVDAVLVLMKLRP